MFKLKKGDKVIVLTGKYKYRKGIILKIFPKTSKAIVKKIFVVKKHVKSNLAYKKGKIIQKELPIQLSNLALFDS